MNAVLSHVYAYKYIIYYNYINTYIGVLLVGLKYFFTKFVVRTTKKVRDRCIIE